MITRNLSIELAPLNITINNIAPGAIETPINKNLLNDPVKLKSLLDNIPLRRLGKPEDVASIAAFLASEESSYVTGTTFVVDGGLTWNYEEQ
jgi:glucose 1-dehydrogenase